MSVISSHDRDALKAYFDAQVSRPRWKPWLRGGDTLEPSVTIPLAGVPVKIGGPRELFRTLTLDSRAWFAAWHWLRPDGPYSTLDRLPSLRHQAGLDHLDSANFVLAVTANCREMARQHEPLGLWVRRRISLLEHAASPPHPVSHRYDRAAFLLRQTLFFADAPGGDAASVGAKLDLTAQVGQDALETAGALVAEALGVDAPQYSVNLMVPMRLRSREGPDIRPNNAEAATVAAENREKAAALWQTCKADRCLTVVAETRNARHLGFWVPLCRGHHDADIPGAPRAFFRGEGFAVFKDDLPKVIGFDPGLADDWDRYMRRDFQDSLFVSLPFSVPRTTGGTGDAMPIAVVNVNAIRSDDDTSWMRAYHPICGPSWSVFGPSVQ
jgi:hypothetical protein